MENSRHDRASLAPNRAIAVIPARSASTRLPDKLLLRETGKSVLQHTFEAVQRASLIQEIVIAAADDAIAKEARSFGAHVLLTDPDLPSGTDRVAAVAKLRSDVSIFVNVQGDEPEIIPADIDRSVAMLHQESQLQVATLATPIRSRRDLEDPACVKVVLDDRGRALYFSRSPIPFVRDGLDTLDFTDRPVFLQHVGLYAYRRSFLLQLHQLPASTLEQLERLEQLRVLSAGIPIQVAVIDHAARGIDTADDYRQFVSRMSA